MVVDQLDKEIADAKAAGNRALKKELKRRYLTTSVALAHTTDSVLSLELLLIEARNDHVKEGLQQAYAAKAPDGKLDVFCVSNKLYDKYSRKGNTRLVVASGIPEIRRFCHSITAEAQLGEARHFLQSALFSLLNSLNMWARRTLASAKAGGTGSEELARKAALKIAETVACQFSSYPPSLG